MQKSHSYKMLLANRENISIRNEIDTMRMTLIHIKQQKIAARKLEADKLARDAQG